MKRTLLLCAALVVLTVALAASAYAYVEVFRLGVPSGDNAPAFIQFTLNCPASAEIKIYPSDASGNITGPAVKTETIAAVRGKNTYIWPCTDDMGAKVPVGHYVASIAVTATQTQWDPIIGIFTWNEPDIEHPARPLPTVGDTEGFYGVAINKRKGSPYYGQMFVAMPKADKVLHYDVDGTFLREIPDAGIVWGASGPWDCYFDEQDPEDWLYIGDRSNHILYRVKPGVKNPDGTWQTPVWQKAPNDQFPYYRAMFGRMSGNDHFHLGSGDSTVTYNWIKADGTWTTKLTSYNAIPDATDDSNFVYGMWMTPNRQTLYQSILAGSASQTNKGVTQWSLTTTGVTYSRTGWQQNGASLPGGTLNTPDVVKSPVNDPATGVPFLWVTNFAAYSTSGSTAGLRALYKLDANTGAILPDDFDIITWGHMVDCDAVGNVAVTFGKSAITWGQYYWGVFAPVGSNTVTAQAPTGSAFYVPSDPAPVVWPDSDTWTFSDPNYPGKLFPDNTATATITFKVLDADGWQDIDGVFVDLSSLGYSSATPVTSKVCDIDGSPTCTDPTHLAARCTLSGIKAVRGTKAGQHNLVVTAYDQHFTTPNNPASFDMMVAGATVNGYVRHTRWPATVPIDGATIVAVGGKPGSPGYPHTYRFPATDSQGFAEMELSEGTYQVHAEKVGFKQQADVTRVVADLTSPPGFPTAMGDIMLGPLTVAEARQLEDGTYCSVEGVVFASSESLAPDQQYGFAPKTDLLKACRQWYLCDPGANGADAGINCLIKQEGVDALQWQWNDPNGMNPLGTVCTYLGTQGVPGAQPTVGETVCFSGTISTPGGAERRIRVEDTKFTNSVPRAQLSAYYLNRGVVSGMEVPAPKSFTIADISHIYTTGSHPHWGKYGRISGAVVVKKVADGHWVAGNANLGDTIPYFFIADAEGNWASATLETPTSLNITGWPDTWPVLGGTYTLTGPIGRRARYGEGTIKLRSNADAVLTAAAPSIPSANNVASMLSLPNGTTVTVRGLVSSKSTSYMTICSPDGKAYMRVNASPFYVECQASPGPRYDEIVAVGTLSTNGPTGIRTVNITSPVLVVGQSSTLPPQLPALPTPAADSLKDIRGVNPDGSVKEVRGIVTYKNGADMYIESPGREVGLKVKSFISAAVGDDVTLRGYLTIDDGEKALVNCFDGKINNTEPGTPPAAFDMRTRDVGGAAYGPYDPGVTDGKGALNVGLRIHVSGMVTAVGADYFYVWDGANKTDQPVDDGTGNKGVRVKGSPTGLTPWVTWVDVVGISSANATAVSGKVIPEILATEITPITEFETVTADAGTALNAGWNLMSLPVAPAATGDGDDMDMVWSPWMVVAPNKIPDDLDGIIYRWEAATQSLVMFDMWSPETFGGMLLGDGYWVRLASPWSISYTGVSSTLDKWIGVPSSGWLLIGLPRQADMEWDGIQVHNGAIISPNLTDAGYIKDPAWVQTTGYWWDNTFQGLVDIGVPDDWPSSTTMTAWHGFWFKAFQGNKALIFPNSAP